MRLKVQRSERYWAKMPNQCSSQAEFSTKLKQLNPTTATASTSKSISEARFSFANPTHMHQRELLIYQRTFQQRTWCITRGKPTLLFCFGIPPPPAAQFGPAASKLLLQTSFQLQSLGQTSTDTNTPYAGADDRGVALPSTHPSVMFMKVWKRFFLLLINPMLCLRKVFFKPLTVDRSAERVSPCLDIRVAPPFSPATDTAPLHPPSLLATTNKYF